MSLFFAAWFMANFISIPKKWPLGKWVLTITRRSVWGGDWLVLFTSMGLQLPGTVLYPLTSSLGIYVLCVSSIFFFSLLSPTNAELSSCWMYVSKTVLDKRQMGSMVQDFTSLIRFLFVQIFTGPDWLFLWLSCLTVASQGSNLLVFLCLRASPW